MIVEIIVLRFFDVFGMRCQGLVSFCCFDSLASFFLAMYNQESKIGYFRFKFQRTENFACLRFLTSSPG